MFVALDVAKRPADGIFAKLKGILSRPKTWVEPRESCGVQYAVIHALEGRNGPDWQEIEWLAGEYARWVLLPDGLTLPERTALIPYGTKKFDQLVLLHTACEIAARSRMPMYRRLLGLLDEDGSHAYMLPQLLKHYTAVRVVTRNRYLYEKVSEEMMCELGASVMVSGEHTVLTDCVLALCPSDYAAPEDFSLTCPVLCAGRLTMHRPYDCFSRLLTALPNFAQKPPEGISEHLFAGALYELCDVTQIKLCARSLLFNLRVSTIDDAVRVVMHKAFSPEEYKFIKRG